jgi:hypothetical protein
MVDLYVNRKIRLPIHGDAEYERIMEFAESGRLYQFAGDECLVTEAHYDSVWKRGEFELTPIVHVVTAVIAAIHPDDSRSRQNHVRDAVQANW